MVTLHELMAVLDTCTEAQQQLNTPRTRTCKIRPLQESAALFSFLQANGIQSMQQLHEKIADMNSRYYDLWGKIVKAERRIGKGYCILAYPCQVRRISRHTFAHRKTTVQVSPYGGRLFICRTSRCVCRVRASVSTRTSSSMR